MKSHDILFNISPKKYFVLQLPWPAEYLEKWDRVNFVYHAADHTIYSISSTNVWFLQLLIDLQYGFENAVNKMLPLSTKDIDIGLLWNDYLHEKTSIEDSTLRNYSTAISDYLHKRLLIESHQYSVWIYNQHNKIYLHITPDYFWHFLDPEENNSNSEYETINPQYTTYEEFRATYKPIATIEVSHSLIQEWLTMVNHFFDIINTNYKKISSLDDEQANKAGPYGTFVSTSVESVKENITDDPIVHPCFHHQCPYMNYGPILR